MGGAILLSFVSATCLAKTYHRLEMDMVEVEESNLPQMRKNAKKRALFSAFVYLLCYIILKVFFERKSIASILANPGEWFGLSIAGLVYWLLMRKAYLRQIVPQKEDDQ